MRNRCAWQCASIAVGIALAMRVASAADLSFEVPAAPDGDPLPPIQRCVVTSLRVDGLPVVQHGYCAWDTEQRMWIPLSSNLARKRVFGIETIPE